MADSAWPQPPIQFEDLPAVLELLGKDAERVLRGWVLVPAGCVQVRRHPAPASLVVAQLGDGI